jgi:hypothetical protein
LIDYKQHYGFGWRIEERSWRLDTWLFHPLPNRPFTRLNISGISVLLPYEIDIEQ